MISLYVSNEVAYVWNSDDWHQLRSDHRICGALIGSIASYPRQNDYLGLPMALMSEEAALLVEKNICELVELPKLIEKPSLEEQKEFKELEERVKQEQTEVLRNNRVQELSNKIDKIVEGKKQKLLSKGSKDINLDRETLLQEEINKLPKLAEAHMLVHLPTQHFRQSDKRKVSIDILKPSVIDENGALHYKIFKDLWEKGHYITKGLKFGCDFLVYPGDPVRFHATYMVRCISQFENNFHPTHFVAFGRLAVSVNKMAVFAFCNRMGTINYQTLQWHDSIFG